MVKIERVVPEISYRTDRQTDRQTDTQTDALSTILRSAPAGEVIKAKFNYAS